MDSRHLNEFAHSEVEVIGALDDVIELAERYIKYLARGVIDSCEAEIMSVTGELNHLTSVIDRGFQRLRFEDALEELRQIGGGYKKSDIDEYDITPEGEELLMRAHGECLWLTHLPWKIVPFYQSQEKSNPRYSNTADLLTGIGEILGSGQRVFDGEALDVSLKDHHVDVNGYAWYRQMHDEFPLQTSGFGLGIERFIAWVLHHDDIRDCTLLLRDHKKIIFP